MWWLFRDNLLPKTTTFFGYARTKLTLDELRDRCHQYMKVKPGEEKKYEDFWKLNHYFSGSYDLDESFINFNNKIESIENGSKANRLFYLALPPSVFEPVTVHIKKFCMGKR